MGVIRGEVQVVGGDCGYDSLVSAPHAVRVDETRRIIPPTVGPQARTASTAAAVVQCSSYIFLVSC